MAIFWQKPWTNPFGELRFFWLFSCPQNILLYPEYHETVFFVLFCGKKTVLPSPLPRRFVVGTRFGFLHQWKALEPPEQMFEGSLSLRKNESKGRQHGWQAQYGLGWVTPLFVPMGRGVGLLIKDIYVVVKPSIRFDIPILNIFPPIYILQLQLVKSRPFQIYRLKRVLL